MSTTIKILIDAKGTITGTEQVKQGLGQISTQAQKTKADIQNAVKVDISKGLSGVNDAKTSLASLASVAKVAGGALGIAFGGRAVFNFLSDAVSKSTELENSLKGVESVARSFGASTDAVKQAVLNLTNDGLIGVTDATRAFKNVLSTGTALPDAIKLLNSLKDTATFNRQAQYSLGEAVVATTEGIKNSNSTLADAVGVTKNLSVLDREYAQSIGKTVGQLSDYEKIQARVNGFIREGAFATGDAAKSIDTYSGQISRLGTVYDRVLARIGSFITESLGLKSAVGGLADFLDNFTEKSTAEQILNVEEQILKAKQNRFTVNNRELKTLQSQLVVLQEQLKTEGLRSAQAQFEADQKRKSLDADREKAKLAQDQANAQAKLRKELENVGLTELQILQKKKNENLKIAGNDLKLRLKVEQQFYDEKDKLSKKQSDEETRRANELNKLREKVFEVLGKAAADPFASIQKPLGLTDAQSKEFDQRQAIGRGAGIGNLISQGAEGAKKLVTGVASTAINAIVPGLGDALGPLISSLTAGPEATREFVRAFTGAIPDLVQGLIEAIPVLIEELANQFPVVIERLAERADDIILALVKSIPKVTVALAKTMPDVAIQFAGSLIKEVPNIIGALISGIGEGIKKLFENLLGGGEGSFLGGGGGFLGNIKDKTLGAVLGGSVGGVTGVSGILQAFSNPGQFFSSFASDPLGSIGNIFGFAKGGEISSVKGGVPFIDSVPAKLQSGELVADRTLTSKMKTFFGEGEGHGSSEQMQAILEAVNRPVVVSTQVSLNQKTFADIILNLNRTSQRLT